MIGKRSRPVREGAVRKRTSTAGTSPDGLPHPPVPSSPRSPPTKPSSTNPAPAQPSPNSPRQTDHHPATTTTKPRPALRQAGLQHIETVLIHSDGTILKIDDG